MAATLRGGFLQTLRTCWRVQSEHLKLPVIKHMGVLLPALRHQGSHTSKSQSSFVPETSLSRAPWPEVVRRDPEEERQRHAAVVEQVNARLAQGDVGRLFAVVHLASRQWKVTNEDLILIESHIEAECGDRIRLDKVLLVGGEDFTLVGRPLLGRELVRVEATVLEKTDSWPKVLMRFLKRKRYQRKRIIVTPQTVLRINSIEVAPRLT